jgi:hypothetical protein
VPVQFGAGYVCRRRGGFADARAFLPGRLVRTPGLPEGPGRFTARAGRPVSLRIDPLDLRRPVATARRLFDLRIPGAAVGAGSSTGAGLLTGLPRGLRALPGAASCLERLNRFPGTHLRLRYRPLTCAVMTPA